MKRKRRKRKRRKEREVGRQLRLVSGQVLWLTAWCGADRRVKSQGWDGEKTHQKKGSWRQFWRPQKKKSCCHRMDWVVWSQKCYGCSSSGGFKAASRGARETAGTIVSAENTLICRKHAKVSIKFDITELHLEWLILHPTATLFWLYLGLGIFAFKQKKYLLPLGCYFHPSPSFL